MRSVLPPHSPPCSLLSFPFPPLPHLIIVLGSRFQQQRRFHRIAYYDDARSISECQGPPSDGPHQSRQEGSVIILLSPSLSLVFFSYCFCFYFSFCSHSYFLSLFSSPLFPLLGICSVSLHFRSSSLLNSSLASVTLTRASCASTSSGRSTLLPTMSPLRPSLPSTSIPVHPYCMLLPSSSSSSLLSFSSPFCFLAYSSSLLFQFFFVFSLPLIPSFPHPLSY